MGLFGPPNIEKLEAQGKVKKLIAVLQHDDYGIKHKAMLALIRIGEPAIAECVKTIASDWPGFYIYYMVQILPAIGEPAIEQLASLLGHSHEGVRRSAIRILKHIQSEKVIEPLLRGAKDANQLNREYALEGLLRINDTSVVDSLLGELSADVQFDPLVATVLGATQDERVFEPLVKILHELGTEENLRVIQYMALVKAAMQGLALCGDPRSVAEIRALPESEVDMHTLMPAKIKAMATIGTGPAIDALTSLEVKRRQHQPWVVESSGLKEVYKSTPLEQLILLGMKPQNTELVKQRLLALEELGSFEQLLLQLPRCKTGDECVAVSKQLLHCDPDSLILPMIALFEHPDLLVRSAASGILGKIARSKYKGKITRLGLDFLESTSALVRKGAAEVFALGKVSGSLKDLQMAQYTEKDPEVHKTIVWAIERIQA